MESNTVDKIFAATMFLGVFSISCLTLQSLIVLLREIFKNRKEGK